MVPATFSGQYPQRVARDDRPAMTHDYDRDQPVRIAPNEGASQTAEVHASASTITHATVTRQRQGARGDERRRLRWPPTCSTR